MFAVELYTIATKVHAFVGTARPELNTTGAPRTDEKVPLNVARPVVPMAIRVPVRANEKLPSDDTDPVKAVGDLFK